MTGNVFQERKPAVPHLLPCGGQSLSRSTVAEAKYDSILAMGTKEAIRGLIDSRSVVDVEMKEIYI